LSKGGVQWGYGPTARDLVPLAQSLGDRVTAVERQRIVECYIEGEILRYHHLRQVSAAVNKTPGPDASLRKALNDPHGKRVFNLAKDLAGANGMLFDPEGFELWSRGFLFSPALTVGGGTSEVLRNVIAERILGLPHDHDVEQGKTWAETKGGAVTS
jgi:alkylation response protein AidB-like acyl-CoA dehydrogenase